MIEIKTLLPIVTIILASLCTVTKADWYTDAWGNMCVDDGGQYIIDSIISTKVMVDFWHQPNPGTQVELISGGYLGQHLEIYGYGDVTISGGVIEGYLSAGGYSNVDILGGLFGDNLYSFTFLENAVGTFFGTDFQINGSFVGHGMWTGEVLQDRFRLTGILANGTSIDNYVSLLDEATTMVLAVPEPTTLLLLGLGGLVLRKRRR
ncbi:MAG: PEP-CTERM sorting domain-containing protein [Sedimentisphaerales bacterium]